MLTIKSMIYGLRVQDFEKETVEVTSGANSAEELEKLGRRTMAALLHRGCRLPKPVTSASQARIGVDFENGNRENILKTRRWTVDLQRTAQRFAPASAFAGTSERGTGLAYRDDRALRSEPEPSDEG